VSLAEMAADLRASTPSNAAELLSPEKDIAISMLREKLKTVYKTSMNYINENQSNSQNFREQLEKSKEQILNSEKLYIDNNKNILLAFDPLRVLKRGYSIVRSESGRAVTSIKEVKPKDSLTIQLSDGDVRASVIG